MDIRLDAISHSYGETEVLRDITLNIPSGQIVCLVGPSGFVPVARQYPEYRR